MNIFQRGIQTIQKNFLGLGHSITAFGWQIPGRWNKRQQLEQYNRYVYTIVSAFALDFAKTGYKLVKNEKEQTNHELIDLLESPNPEQSGFQFRELHATYMKLAGESFWYLVNKRLSKKPKEIYLLRPDLVDIKLNDNNLGTIKKYVLNLPTGKKQEFEPEEIRHFKYPNPMNPKRGMGVVEAAMTYLQTEDYSSQWTKNSIYNSGRPSGILNLKGKMDDKQFEQLKENFKQEYTGTTNAGKTLLLKGFDGIDWAKLGMDLEGIDLKSVKDLTREDIMFMFRTSNTIMGITDDVNRANSREMRGVWMENVIKPELDRFVDEINHSLTPIYAKDLTLEYEDPNPETIEDRVVEWEKGVDKWLTKNDIIRERNQILGTDIPEKDGGDEIWQPLSLVPMKIRAERKSEEKHIHNVEKNVEKEEEEPEKEPKIELTKRERGELMRKNIFREQESWEEPFEEQVNKVFEAQKKEILDRVKSIDKDFEEWLFDRLESALLWKELITPIATEIVVSQSKYMFDFVDDESVAGELEITPSIRNAIEQRIDRWTSDVDIDTRESLNATINEGVRAGESVAKLRKRIESVYDQATGMRSTRIARTETIHLSNMAQLEAMQALPSVVGKQWMTNPGACEFCQPLEGMIVNLGTNFVNQGEVIDGADGGSYVTDYEDVLHPPLHPNCRCTILPVNREEMKDVRIHKLEHMLEEYKEMDKRTKEAREMLDTMKKEKEELAEGKKELNETLKKIEDLIK
jgi:HK97 family phage portal protein